MYIYNYIYIYHRSVTTHVPKPSSILLQRRIHGFMFIPVKRKDHTYNVYRLKIYMYRYIDIHRCKMI